jgi:hypothetical protein
MGLVGMIKSYVFDYDGVALNSNKIKTQAFYDVAKVYGHDIAQALKGYHVQNGGIFGSPDNEDKILANELKNKNITQPTLLLESGKYYYQTAGLDFTLLIDWTEIIDWQSWVNENNLKNCQNLTDLAFYEK